MRSTRWPGAEVPHETSVTPDHFGALHDLMRLLPSLITDVNGVPDYVETSPSLLVDLSESAEQAALAINVGVAAVGSLLSFVGPEVDDGGEPPRGCIAALGWLLAELVTTAVACTVLEDINERE